MKISSTNAIEILDSRGKPTVRAFITLEDGSVHSASVPSGSSTGSHEALELRDGDIKRHMGQGVLKAVDNINTKIAPAIQGHDADPQTLDKIMIELDGTAGKTVLGANAILGVSMAITRASAHIYKRPLWQFIKEYYFAGAPVQFPRLMVNIVNGGKHAGWNFDIQEFMIVPNSKQPTVALQIASEIFQQLGAELKDLKLSRLVGDEGGYSPALTSNEHVLDLTILSAEKLGYKNAKDFHLALDVAATEFYKDGKYILQKTNQVLSGDDLLKYYQDLRSRYFITSFEDPFAEDDWDHFHKMTDASGDEYHIVGDDLFVTNVKRIQRGIESQASNAVLIKLNQIGSVSETIEAIKLTKAAGWKVVVSHRSGETEDAFIADLAYGVSADYIKTGSMSRSERLAKYNRLIEIEHGF
ncbi:MAG: phosphopyruvate hydratase [Candidatus Roizmanbacteria bacterium]